MGLFQPFSSGDVRHGSGGGLGMRQQIARALGGSIAPANRRPGTMSAMTTPFESMRLDKWLWCARFYKTRSLAVDEIGRGRVTVNGQAVKAARDLRVGLTAWPLTVTRPRPISSTARLRVL